MTLRDAKQKARERMSAEFNAHRESDWSDGTGYTSQAVFKTRTGETLTVRVVVGATAAAMEVVFPLSMD